MSPLRGLLVKSSSIENCKSTNKAQQPLAIESVCPADPGGELRYANKDLRRATRLFNVTENDVIYGRFPATKMTANHLRKAMWWPHSRVSQSGKSCRACWLVCRIPSTQKKWWGMTSAEGYLRKFQCAPDNLFTFSLLFLWVIRVKGCSMRKSNYRKEGKSKV